MKPIEISLTVNNKIYKKAVEPRKLLSDFLRQDLALTGTHIGCEHGVCGACTILLDDKPVRSCIIFAVQAHGKSLTTVEGLCKDKDEMHPIQQAFKEAHALQCGFCTPGFLMTIKEFLHKNNNPSDEEIREALSGNLCRCTGYNNIVKAVKLAAKKLYPQE